MGGFMQVVPKGPSGAEILVSLSHLGCGSAEDLKRLVGKLLECTKVEYTGGETGAGVRLIRRRGKGYNTFEPRIVVARQTSAFQETGPMRTRSQRNVRSRARKQRKVRRRL